MITSGDVKRLIDRGRVGILQRHESGRYRLKPDFRGLG